MRNLALIGYLLGLFWLAAGCQIFGDFEVADAPSGCTSGQLQCVGGVLQTCNRAGNGWENAAVCASETLCDAKAGMCRAPVCANGERRCLDAELQICNGTRDGWITLQTCATAAHCTQTGGCTQAPCLPGAVMCNGAVLQSCDEDQSGWTPLATCDSPALCNEATGMCDEAACTPGAFTCQGAELQGCNATLDGWTTLRVCESAALCDAEGGTCSQGACTIPGAFRCMDDGVLERCGDDLTGWELVDACASEAHCDAVSGTCTAEPCTPGSYQCNGAMLEVCNADRTGRDPVDTCETEGLCQETLEQGATECQAPYCDEGEFQCAGAQPQVCNGGRTGYRDNGAPCATEALCNGTTGTCAEPVCEPGQARCNGAQPEVCNADQTGYVPSGTPCASAALCSAATGTCADAACEAGETRCNPLAPTELQRCKPTLDGWDTCDTCATAGLCNASLSAASCDATSCTEPTCELSHLWCGGSDNRTLFKCPASRINSEPDVLDVCVTAELCALTHSQNQTKCVAPSCAPTDRWCGGSGNRSLYQCPPSRINTQAQVLDTCATSGLCEQAHSQGSATCPEPACEVGQTQCGGTGNRTLRMCRSDRTGYTDCDVCDTSALCTDSLGATSCNSNACLVCTEGQKQCSGSQLQICNEGRDGWTNLALCGSSTLCMNSLTPASQTTCDACIANSRGCNGAQPVVCEDPSTGPSAWVADGTACDAAALCNPATGTCVCSLGDTRCNPTSDNFEECGSTGWAEVAECSDGCDDDTGCL